ncbi:MAG: C13 family peptidase [Promethearchaeota archaeon]
MGKTKTKLILLLIILQFGVNFGIYPIYIEDNSTAEISVSSIKSAAENADLGAWIIVAGDRDSDHALYYAIEQGAIQVYNILIGLGYDASDICFLAGNWDGSLPANAQRESTRANVEWAITTWAAGKVNSLRGLGIYLFDHGGGGVMGLPGVNLGENHLNSYLDTLESSTGMERSVIVYEACHAGSFINPVSKEGRIIVCATDIAHSSYPNGDHTWAYFSECFWSWISMGYTIGTAFEHAVHYVYLFGLSDIQKPWIDDNHDETGHEVDSWGNLPNGGDGSIANNLYITAPPKIYNYIHLVTCPIRSFYPRLSKNITLWVVAENNTKINDIYAYVKPWWFQWPEPVDDPDDDGDEITYFPNNSAYLPMIKLSRNPDSNNYSVNFDPLKYRNLFGQGDGDYQIIYGAKTAEGFTADVITSTVTLNEEGVAPSDQTPPTISFLNPTKYKNVTKSVNISARADDDQGLETVQILMDGEVVKEEDMPDYHPYPDVTFLLNVNRWKNGEHNLTAIATDKSGNIKQTTLTITINKAGISGFPVPLYGLSFFFGIVIIQIFRFNKKKNVMIK